MKLISLSQGKFAQVDDSDYEQVNKYSWWINTTVPSHTFYAQGWVDKGRIKMHRFVLGLSPSDKSLVDHIDGNGLNNQRSNLRIATRSQNKCNSRKYTNNTSGFKGVSWDKDAKKWKAQVRLNGQNRNLGRFKTREEAFDVYAEKAKELQGEFARVT